MSWRRVTSQKDVMTSGNVTEWRQITSAWQKQLWHVRGRCFNTGVFSFWTLLSQCYNKPVDNEQCLEGKTWLIRAGKIRNIKLKKSLYGPRPDSDIIVKTFWGWHQIQTDSPIFSGLLDPNTSSIFVYVVMSPTHNIVSVTGLIWTQNASSCVLVNKSQVKMSSIMQKEVFLLTL